MKILKAFLYLLFVVPLNLGAQQYPLEWQKYTRGEYLFDIQSDIKNISESENEIKNRLADASRVNVAKQIKLKIDDNARLVTVSNNGHTNKSYIASTQFSTNLDMKLVETRTYYNAQTNEAFAVAFIEKGRACRYYENEYFQLINAIESAFIIANNYIQTGYKEKAKTELQAKEKQIQDIEEVLFWLNIFDFSSEQLSQFQIRKSNAEQQLKQTIADLQHSLTIYLECNAQISGVNYPKLQNELKGIIAKEGCSFTTDKSQADYVIVIEACNDEGFENVIAGMKSYFTYISASIVIDKVATSQRIYEDELTVKGGHTRSISEAAKAGYKEVQKRLGNIITDNVKE